VWPGRHTEWVGLTDDSAAPRHALEQRRQHILRRLAELSAWQPVRGSGRSEERAARARRHIRDAQVSAHLALVSYRQALVNSVQAHDRAAEAHQRALARGFGDPADHERCIAFHKDAAEADRQRADQVSREIEQARRVVEHLQGG
jgi:hypothetical protein